jgi:hypothetical protein
VPPRSRRSATPPGRSRLSVSPLLLPLDDGVVEPAEAAQGQVVAVGHALGQVDEQALDVVGHRGWSHLAGGGDGLDRLARGDHRQQVVVVRGQLVRALHRAHERADDRGVEHRAAGRHLPDGPGQLVALGDAVLQQVGVAGGALRQERDGVVRIVVLREDDHAGAGVALADLLAGVDALPLEVRRHPDVRDDDLRFVRLGPGHQRVVVLRRPDDREVRLRRQHGPHALADDHAVVGDQHADALVPHPLS